MRRRMEKRAQIPGQVIIYIFGAAVVIMVLFFGLRAVTSLGQQSKDIARVNFEKSLNREISQLVVEWGSMSEKTFSLPAGVNRICFIDATIDPMDPSEITTENLAKLNPIMVNYWKSANADESKENVFLIGEQVEPIFIGEEHSGESYFQVAPVIGSVPQGALWFSGVLCPPVTDRRFTITISGEGRFAKIDLPG
ncbi:MAG: hypothetical protein ABIC95_04730 [archaeon]